MVETFGDLGENGRNSQLYLYSKNKTFKIRVEGKKCGFGGALEKIKLLGGANMQILRSILF